MAREEALGEDARQGRSRLDEDGWGGVGWVRGMGARREEGVTDSHGVGL